MKGIASGPWAACTAPGPAYSGSLHVLLAEDDACTRLVVQQLLRRCGYTVTTARDGQEALEALQACDKVDLILTDLIMPQVNGIKLASEVGKASKWCHLPVVVMSGEASEGTVREAFAAGVADYLVKPIRRNEALTLWQHVWRSMQALTGRRLEGAKKRAAEPSKGAASQGLSSRSCASEQTVMPASKRACTEQARMQGAAMEIREGCDSGLSEGAAFHSMLPGMPAGCTQQEAPDLAGCTTAHPASGLPRIVSAPCILSSGACSSEAAGPAQQQEAPSSNSSGSGAIQQSSASTLRGWKRSQVPIIDLEIAPLDLGPAALGGADGQQSSSCGQQQAEDAAAASLCALARGVCAMLPLACAQIEAQLGWDVSMKWAGDFCAPKSNKEQQPLHPKQQPQVTTSCRQKAAEGIAVAASGDPAVWAANRKAALQKLREKKKLRNFEKKVRYESRRRLAESRPRVRGQFVKASALVKAE